MLIVYNITMNRKCYPCKTIKPIHNFSRKNYECKSCACIRSRKYRSNNLLQVRLRENKRKAQLYIDNLDYINNYKNERCCVDCNTKYPPYVLQFDHCKGTKSNSIKNMKHNSSLNTIIKEIEKCELVCANCHRNRTYKRYIHNKSAKRNRSPTKLKLQKIVNKLKSDRPCNNCNIHYNYWQLDYDHRNPEEKILSICEMVVKLYPINDILNEIIKCDLLCANCHTEKTAKQLNYYNLHKNNF